MSTPAIRPYLAERRAASTRGLPRARAVELLRRVSSPRLREAAKANGTTLLWPLSKRRVRAMLRDGRTIRLNLGSGRTKLPGWVNIDLLGMNPDLPWNLRHGIPFPDESVDAVFLEHFLEHLPAGEALEMLEKCRRVLVPGGTIRVGVPDFGRYMESYAGDGEFIERLRPGRPTALLAVAEVALEHGHRSVWDRVTLERTLAEAGFTDVQIRRFADSSLDPPPDTPMREAESVYVEGTKPERGRSPSERV
jgi:predicted SAM-dependent methyltransferase